MEIVQFVTQSLGDNSYLVVSGNRAAVIDAQRDVRPYLEAARARGATIEYAFETHVHNDYISGGRELAALGATIVAPAKAGLQFPHRGIADGDEVAIGGTRLQAVAAPGHTYNHTAYLAIDETGTTKGVFSGGAVLIASAGRSDLRGHEHTEELTRLQWESAKRIAELVPMTGEVLPTHGAGSFCSSAGAAMERRALLAEEFERNPLFTSETYDLFREIHLATKAATPVYYQYMSGINRAGAKVFGSPPTPAHLDEQQLAKALANGVPVVDVRSRFAYIAGSIPGTLAVEEADSLLAYIDWILPFNSPLALVTEEPVQAERVTTDLFRIGYEEVRGFLPFGEWQGRLSEPLRSVSLEDAAEIVRLRKMPVLDVRFAQERELDPLPGALDRGIDEFQKWQGIVPDEQVLVVCASGQRSSIVASVLRARGHDVLVLPDGGATDLKRLL